MNTLSSQYTYTSIFSSLNICNIIIHYQILVQTSSAAINICNIKEINIVLKRHAVTITTRTVLSNNSYILQNIHYHAHNDFCCNFDRKSWKKGDLEHITTSLVQSKYTS